MMIVKVSLVVVLLSVVSCNNDFFLVQDFDLVKGKEKKMEKKAEMGLLEADGDEEMQNFFDVISPYTDEFLGDLRNISDEDLGLDRNSTSGWSSMMEEILGMVKGDFCANYTTTSPCEESMIMGCNCHAHFAASQCSSFPCQAIQHFYNNGPGMLRRLQTAESFSDLVEMGYEFSYDLTKTVCSCNPSLYQTTMSCIQSYNGALLGEDDRKKYYKTMKKIKFDFLSKALEQVTNGYCGSNSTNTATYQCVWPLNTVAQEFTRMFDRSLHPENSNSTCDNYRRVSDTIWAVFEELEKQGENMTADSIIQTLTKIPRNLWCGSKPCAKSFDTWLNNNCCFRGFIGKIDMGLFKNLKRFFKSIFKKDMPKISKKSIKKLVKAADPLKSCKKKYGKEQC